jgi:hypothetical protein
VQVLLVGDEEGMAETAAEFRVRHLPGVVRNELGTPLVSSIFELARTASDSPLMVYVNADIMLMPEFVATSRLVMGQLERFLIVGQRYDLEVKEAMDFSPGWDDRLSGEVTRLGRIHPPSGSDYFVFPRELYAELPDFAIGRAGWDNWMIYHGVCEPWPVIDATSSIMIVHQDHDYGHLPNGEAHYRLEETRQNAQLGGGMHNMYLLLDAERELVGSQIRRPRPSLVRILRMLERWMHPRVETTSGLRWYLARRLRRWRIAARAAEE